LLPDTKAEVAVPIAIGDNVLGVLDVQHNITGGLSESDADLIQSIANQVAIAVQNAQAYTHSQRQAVREAQITAINQRIQSAATIDDVLQIAVSELGQVLETQQASIELQVGSQPDNGRD
jgi:GAF domain-containing protein